MSTHLIHRRHSEGLRLHVPNLNDIQVLIDRGDTRFTEVGLNTWPAGISGPPHNHEAKEQIFYITSGTGWIVVGAERFSVQPGDTVYIPPSVVHQTVAGPEGPLTYILFNAFLDDRKEGHASFEEHVKALGETRSRQAALGTANIDGSPDFRSSSEKAHHVSRKKWNSSVMPQKNKTINLLEKTLTRRSAAQITVRLPYVAEEISADNDTEQTGYVVSGSAQLEAADDLLNVSDGDVVFVPTEKGLRINAGASGVKWLWLRTYLNSGTSRPE